MDGYGHNSSSLVEVLRYLQDFNSANADTLSEHNAYQQNQVSNLLQLGMVEETPTPPASGNADMGNIKEVAKPTLLQAIARELNRMKLQSEIFREQTRNAKFISDALYRQIELPNENAVGTLQGNPR